MHVFNRASPDYFKAIGQHVLRGRTFTPADTATSPGVAVVNQAFVKKLFKPGQDPIGQHLGWQEIKSAGDFEIVGVVEDTKYKAHAMRAADVFHPDAAAVAHQPA